MTGVAILKSGSLNDSTEQWFAWSASSCGPDRGD